jgi:hypothetical protein
MTTKVEPEGLAEFRAYLATLSRKEKRELDKRLKSAKRTPGFLVEPPR